MARQREGTSAKETAYSEKHRILQALDDLATPESWSEFKQIRKAYRKFRKNNKNGDRFDRKGLLQDCEDKGLIRKQERELILATWDEVLDPILDGMEKGLNKVKKGDALKCWITYSSDGVDRVVHHRQRKTVSIDIHTRRPRPGPWKGLLGMDPGFLRRLEAHHREIGDMLAQVRAEEKRRGKNPRR